MQSLEAVLSLLVFLLITTQIIPFDAKPVNDSLYRIQLANDVWRVLYLKNDFEDFSFTTGNPSLNSAEKNLIDITDVTGICVSVRGFGLWSCRPGNVYGWVNGEQIITIKKILVVSGVPSEVTLTLYKKM